MNRQLTRMGMLAGIAVIVTASAIARAEEAAATNRDAESVAMTVDHNTEFAIDIYKQLAADNNDNLFLSPYSISTALAMLAEGARGETAEELGRLLHFPESTRRGGGSDQSIPWQTAKIYSGISRLDQSLGHGADRAASEQARSRFNELQAELQATREKLRDLKRNPPEDLSKLQDRLRKRHKDYAELARNRRGVKRGTREYDKYSVQMAAARSEVDRLHRQQRDATDVLLKPLLENEKSLVDDFNAALQRVEGYQLDMANALWAEKSLPFEKTYVDAVSATFKTGGLMMADFRGQPDAERLRINTWVEKKTSHRIKDFLAPGTIHRDTGLVITNAIYFLGEWAYPFKESRTQPREFMSFDGVKSDAPMMSARWFEHGLYGAVDGDGTVFVAPKMYDENNPPRLYPDDDGFHLLSLPYRGGQASMILLVPMRHDGVTRIDQELGRDSLTQWIKALQSRQAHVMIPKFRLQESFELNEPLESLGLSSAFVRPTVDGGADFTGIANPPRNQRLFISRVIHKTFVEVNERGTEAAAATAIITDKSEAAPRPKLVPFIPDIRADRPFLFLIRHNQTGTILFMGRIMKPVA